METTSRCNLHTLLTCQVPPDARRASAGNSGSCFKLAQQRRWLLLASPEGKNDESRESICEDLV